MSGEDTGQERGVNYDPEMSGEDTRQERGINYDPEMSGEDTRQERETKFGFVMSLPKYIALLKRYCKEEKNKDAIAPVECRIQQLLFSKGELSFEK